MPSRSDPLGESFAALSRFFVGDGTLQETLDRVADLAAEAVPGADLTGITMLVEGKPKTAVFTDEAAPEIDATQYETGVGPCLDAFRHQEAYRIDETEKDDRWPSFAAAAAAHGVRSTMSLPLVVNREGVGALNFYARSPAAFSADDEALGNRFAVQAAIALANAQAYWDARQLGEDLRQAMASRAVIEQAKGVVMATQRCGADEAFQVLVRASQRENRKLREIAEATVGEAAQRRRRP